MSCPFNTQSSVLQTETSLSSLPKASVWEIGSTALKMMVNIKLESILEKAFTKYGPIFQAKSIVIMKGPEALKFLFLASPERLPRAPIAEAGLVSLATMDGKIHTKHKQFVMQALQKKYLLHFGSKMKETFFHHLSEWAHKFEIEKSMAKLSTDIILQNFLGFSVYSEEFKEFSQSYESVLNRGSPSKLPWSKFQKAIKAKEKLWGFLQTLVDKNKAQPKSNAISFLIEARSHFPEVTDEDLLNYLYMLAEFGQEDLATMLTFSIATLAARPDLRNQLSEEMLPWDLNDFEVERISNLPMLQNFIREVERLYPPVPFILRYAAADHNFNGYRISKGMKLLGSIYHTHRDAKIFDQPLLFNPMRYLNNDSAKAVTAFGGGFHMCPAKQYVYIQLSMVLFILLKTCTIENLLAMPQIHYAPKARIKNKIALKITVRGLVA